MASAEIAGGRKKTRVRFTGVLNCRLAQSRIKQATEWLALIFLGVPLMLIAESGESPLSPKFGRTLPRPVRWLAHLVVLVGFICLLVIAIGFVRKIIQS